MTYAVNDAVTLKRTLSDPASGDSPGGILANPGEKLIVRSIDGLDVLWPISVSHEYRSDSNTFLVSPAEIEPYPTSPE